MIGAGKETVQMKRSSKNYEQWLLDSHLSLQKIAVYYLAPFSIIFFGVITWLDPCWQSYTVWFGFIGTALSWPICLRLTKDGRPETSLLIFVISVLGFVTLLMMIQGAQGTTLTALILIIIYSSTFSRWFLYLSTTGTLVSFISSELVRYFEPYQFKATTKEEHLFTEIAFSLLIIPVIALILSRSHRMKDRMVDSSQKMNTELKGFVEAVENVGETLEMVVPQIQDVTNSYAAQTVEQSTSIKEINAAISKVRNIAGDTAASATDNNLSSSTILEKSIEGGHQLREMEKSFNEIADQIRIAESEFAELAVQAESIDDILSANREIAAQIKILAVNAGIQAAKAGKYGKGFRVVANELKAMIGSTEESLVHSRVQLEEIRNRAKKSALTIQKSMDLLSRQVHKIGATGNLIDELSNTFGGTLKIVEKIARASKEQQIRLDEVGSGINHIDYSAEELSSSVDVLLMSIDTISESNIMLQDVLSNRSDH